MRNLVRMILFVLAFGFVASWTILGASGAQSVTPAQREAIRDLANVIAASEACGFAADVSVVEAFLDRHGFRLETMGDEHAFDDRLDAGIASARAAVRKDRATFCKRAWEMFGPNGSKIPGALRREI